VGGFGIVVLVLLIYEKPKTAQNLFLAEGRIEDFYFDMKKIARAIVIIYSAYTVVGIIALKLIGLSWLDAFVHTMTSIATGGYSSNAIGIGVYGNGAILIGIALMYIGSISFLKHHQLLTGKFKAFFFDPEIRFFNIVVLITTIIICFELFLTTKSNYLDGLFYVISAISGTGAGTPFTINMMAPVSIFILILLMIFGATYGSTTGGIKIWRIIILFKVIAREIIKPFYPKGTILNIKIGDKIIPDEDALRAISYGLLYITFIIIGSLIFTLAGYSLIQAFFTVASAQGNVGLNIVSVNYYNMLPWLKFQLILHMIIGRVEIIPFIVMLRSIWGK
jgi:trk system potassium uptake protein TrkH